MSRERAIKLSSAAQKELADIFAKKEIKELKDPRFQGLISITDVEVKDNYQHFHFFLSVYQDECKPGILEVLKNAKYRIKGELSKRLRLRVIPTVTFEIDESIKRGDRILQILEEIKND